MWTVEQHLGPCAEGTVAEGGQGAAHAAPAAHVDVPGPMHPMHDPLHHPHAAALTDEVTLREGWPVEHAEELAASGRLDHRSVHMDTIAEDAERTSSAAAAAVAAAAAQPHHEHHGSLHWMQSLKHALSGDSPPSTPAVAAGADGVSGGTDAPRSIGGGGGGNAARYNARRGSAPGPYPAAELPPHQPRRSSPGASAAKPTLTQRLSFGGGDPAARSRLGEMPSSDGSSAVTGGSGGTDGACVNGGGTSLRQRVSHSFGNALSRVSASFKSGASTSGAQLQQQQRHAGADGEDSDPGRGAAAGERATQPVRGHKSGNNTSNSRAYRPLGANSVPVVPVHRDLAAQGRPNLRRRGCYAGLVGSYRQGAGGAQAESAAAAAARTADDEKQWQELKSWLTETTTPWKAHASKLHHLQAQELMEEARKAAEEPKVVRPQAPRQPTLKTLSLALRK